ncbi:AbrB/MazE/SpoVT family DNA-binding domain-containing protein [candidate division KSB1 bacterium]|nr:AbrB/MazE/SpoVT family DNA-binding domain-containing protein [candidate division KSB1 bacterium]
MQICISNANLHDRFSRAFFQASAAILSGLFGGKGFSACCGNGGSAVYCVKLKGKLPDGTTKSSLLFSRCVLYYDCYGSIIDTLNKGNIHMPVVKVRPKRQVTIPEAIFQRLKLQEGDLLKIDILDDATITLISKKSIPKGQQWFWTPTWQRWYREALQEVKQGRVKSFDTVEDFLADLRS